MAKSIVKLARAVADLPEADYENFREWVKFMKALPGAPAKKGDLRKGKKKRKYTRKAVPEVAVEKKPRRTLNEAFPKEEKV